MTASGEHRFSIEAVSDLPNWNNSAMSTLSFDYFKPIDTPQNLGVLNDGKLYLTFSRIVAATDYLLIIGEKKVLASSLSCFYFDNSVAVCIDGLLTVGQNSLCVEAIATDAKRNSIPSKTISYNYFKDLEKTVSTIEENLVSWTFVPNAIIYKLLINDVLLKTFESELHFDLSGLAVGEYTITIIAEAENYTPSQTTIYYEKLL